VTPEATPTAEVRGMLLKPRVMTGSGRFVYSLSIPTMPHPVGGSVGIGGTIRLNEEKPPRKV
jgi:hypothetical protein